MGTGQQIILNRWFVVCITVGFFSLGASLVAIYVFDFTPCTMCMIQRIPFTLLILNGVFGLVGISALAIALITVSFQAIRAALSNPLESMRSE